MDFNQLKARIAGEQFGDQQKAYLANSALESVRAGIGDLAKLGYQFELVEANEAAPHEIQQYPKVLYRGGSENLIVHDLDEEKRALASGFKTAINPAGEALSNHLNQIRVDLTRRNPDMSRAEVDRRLALEAKTFKWDGKPLAFDPKIETYEEAGLHPDKLPDGVIRHGADGPANNPSALAPPSGGPNPATAESFAVHQAPAPVVTDKDATEARIKSGAGASQPNVPGAKPTGQTGEAGGASAGSGAK